MRATLGRRALPIFCCTTIITRRHTRRSRRRWVCYESLTRSAAARVRYAYRYAYRHTYRYTHRHAHRHAYRYAYRYAYRHAYR